MTSRALLQLTTTRKKLRYETSLRVAAATLKDALAGEISSTKVVGTLRSEEDVLRLRLLVGDVADEFDLHAQLAVTGTSFSVRFSPRD